MPKLKTYRLFISHAWSHNAEYYRLQKLLDEAARFKFQNYSVPEHDPIDGSTTTALKNQLLRQIRPVNIVLILAGMYANHSDWIQFEIDSAKNLNKPIIGISPWGQRRKPLIVQDSVNEMVNWNTNSIVRAIRKRAI